MFCCGFSVEKQASGPVSRTCGEAAGNVMDSVVPRPVVLYPGALSKKAQVLNPCLCERVAAFWLVSVFLALPKGMPASFFGVSSARVYTSRIPSVPAVSFLLPKDLNILLMQRLFCSMLGWT